MTGWPRWARDLAAVHRRIVRGASRDHRRAMILIPAALAYLAAWMLWRWMSF